MNQSQLMRFVGAPNRVTFWSVVFPASVIAILAIPSPTIHADTPSFPPATQTTLPAAPLDASPLPAPPSPAAPLPAPGSTENQASDSTAKSAPPVDDVFAPPPIKPPERDHSLAIFGYVAIGIGVGIGVWGVTPFLSRIVGRQLRHMRKRKAQSKAR